MVDAGFLQHMRSYFNSRKTSSFEFRKQQLLNLRAAISKYEDELHRALFIDLKKNPEECWVTETGFLTSEINAALQNLSSWMAPERVPVNLLNFPSKNYILKEPRGVVLIIGPWNYPVQLLLTPLVGSIAGGNCAVLKSSEFAPATSAVMKEMIRETFPPEFIYFIEGDGAEVVSSMLDQFRFDHIFYTGSTSVGRSIYQRAAEQLIPVTLELGGKSPCIIECDADIKVAARRICLAKFSNAGQMCVAPDYVLVHSSVKEKFIEAAIETIQQFFGPDASQNDHYGKIINEKQFNRLVGYLKDGSIRKGGHHDISRLYIEPTVLESVSLDSGIMQDEIFGPILPVIAFNDMQEARAVIARHPDPLALYIFTTDVKKEKEWTETIPFGGGCINNCSWHLTNHHLPFGGRGNSGIGAYHGKNSFDVFSHRKSVMKTPNWFDPYIKYPPFKGRMRLFKWIIR